MFVSGYDLSSFFHWELSTALACFSIVYDFSGSSCRLTTFSLTLLLLARLVTSLAMLGVALSLTCSRIFHYVVCHGSADFRRSDFPHFSEHLI